MINSAKRSGEGHLREVWVGCAHLPPAGSTVLLVSSFVNPLILTVISIKFLLVTSIYSTPEVMRIKDVITEDEFFLSITSPKYFYKRSMGTR